MKLLMIGAAALATALAAPVASAGKYDFDDDDRNDMAAAWTGCEDQYWEPMECAMVLDKCWKRPLMYRRAGKKLTYCKEDPIFSGTETDGQEALDDARQMLGITEPPGNGE